MKPKVGCFFIYSIFLILLGMGLYKYRTEIIDYLSQKYNEFTSRASGKLASTKDDIKDNTP
jgi:hypothetical protein